MAKAPVMRWTARRTASSSGRRDAAAVRTASEVVGLGGGFGAVLLGVEVELVLDEVGDDLGVGLGDELVALGDERLLEGQIVFDDAVVDDDERAGAVAVRMGVLFRGAAVRGPAGVADAEGAVDRRALDDGLEVAQLAGSAAELQAAGAVARGISGDGDAGGVISAVFQAAQAFDDGGDYRLRANVSNDSAHIKSLDGEGADKRTKKRLEIVRGGKRKGAGRLCIAVSMRTEIISGMVSWRVRLA